MLDLRLVLPPPHRLHPCPELTLPRAHAIHTSMIGALMGWVSASRHGRDRPQSVDRNDHPYLPARGGSVIFRGVVDTTNIEGDLEGDAPRLAPRRPFFPAAPPRARAGGRQPRAAMLTHEGPPSGPWLLTPRTEGRALYLSMMSVGSRPRRANVRSARTSRRPDRQPGRGHPAPRRGESRPAPPRPR